MRIAILLALGGAAIVSASAFAEPVEPIGPSKPADPTEPFGDPPNVETSQPPRSTGNRPTLPPPPVDPAPPTPPIEREPAGVEARARALVDEARVCTEAVGCDLHTFDALLGPDTCVAAFQCSVALSADTDLTVFQQAAAALIQEQKATGECVIAGCAPPSELRAVCVEQRCEIVPGRPTPEKGSPSGNPTPRRP